MLAGTSSLVEAIVKHWESFVLVVLLGFFTKFEDDGDEDDGDPLRRFWASELE